VKATGVAGLFYAVQHASANLLSRAEFSAFGREYDWRVLSELAGTWLNVLHVHGNHIYFDLVADYPLQVWNWHDRETAPTLAEGLKQIKGAACGGLARDGVMLRGQPEAVREQVQDAIAQTHGRRCIIGTGCVTMVPTPEVNLRTAIDAARATA
jgi:uroporphyrinogen decarboxylase